jgi:hypothetical protein
MVREINALEWEILSHILPWIQLLLFMEALRPWRPLFQKGWDKTQGRGLWFFDLIFFEKLNST